MVKYGQYTVPHYKDMVNFGVGQPSTELLPLDLVKEAMTKMLDIEDPSILQYGDIPGYYEFRSSLAKHLQIEYDANVEPNNLFISNGVTQALILVCGLFMKSGQTVIVEKPTYFIAINIFKDFNLKIKNISMENDGANLKELEEILKDSNPNDKVLYYTIPAFHNPTSITMSEKKRNYLKNLANKYSNLLVVADEVYQLLYFEEINKPPLPLKYYHENFISLGSFSKILAPSLRLGWIHASDKILEVICNSAQLDSSGGLNPITSSIVHQMLDDGSFAKNVKNNRKILKERCNALYNNIIKNINNIHVNRPEGGYFLWLEFDRKINAEILANNASKYKVKFHTGNKFSSSNDLKNCLRISFSYYSKEGMEVGADRLANLINENSANNNFPRIYINGAQGKLGSLIVETLIKNKFNYRGMLYKDNPIPDDADLIIDVTSETGIKQLMAKLKDKKIPLIIGTTGNLPLNEIKLYSRFAPVAVVSNFSEGIPFISNCLKNVKSQLNNWDKSITEIHHIHKKDSPSGTAKSLAKIMEINNDKIESIRTGENFGEHQIKLCSENEDITIIHQAKSRKIFADGVVKYIKWILTKKNGYYEKIEKEIISKDLEFDKYSGCGNDFIIIKKDKLKINSEISEFVQSICPRGSNIGADGVILIEMPYDKYDIKWTYYNSDGSVAKMCGNGARCVAKYVFDNVNTNNKIKMITGDGIISDAVKTNDDTIITSIDKPEFKNIEDNLRILIENILDNELMKSKKMDNIYRVDILVNHLVIFIKDKNTLENLYIEKYGQIINNLLEVKVNINFVSIDNDQYNIRTYERGVFAETLACGTGCCAFGFVINKFLEKNNCEIKVKSGNIVNINFVNDIAYLEGVANKVYKGSINLDNY